MSDAHKGESLALTHLTARVYDLLTRVCSGLPIPHCLPGHNRRATGERLRPDAMVAAVQRLTQIVSDMPLSEDHQAGVWGASLHWLTAFDLLGVQLTRWEDVRVHAILIALAHAEESLRALASELGVDIQDFGESIVSD